MMESVMLEIFGAYSPIDGCTDWGYISRVAIFGVCLYCMFRLLALVFKR